MNKFFYLACICLGLSMASCSNEEGNYLEQSQQIVDAKQFLTVTYDGKTYENVPVSYDKNGDFIFLDDVFSKVFNQKLKNCGYTMLLEDQTKISFYDNFESLLKGENLSIIAPIDTRSTENSIGTFAISTDNLAGIELYDDKELKDTRKEFTIKSSTIGLTIAIPDLKVNSYKFNDKCSSFRLTNNLPNDSSKTINLGGYTYTCDNVYIVFHGYDDNTYSDTDIICVAAAGSIVYHNQLPGFNDKLSSFQLFFVQKGQSNCDIEEHQIQK